MPKLLMPSVAVVGAGLAGLACAEALQAAGCHVRLFDKGRGPGGRMSTRRVPWNGSDIAFDHGAQYMTARDPAFAAQLAAWHQAGIVAPWPAAGADAWVGTPAMNAPVATLASQFAVAYTCRVKGLARGDHKWLLHGDGCTDEGFDQVVVAVPAEPAAGLLIDHHVVFAAEARATSSQPCWTVMAAFDQPLPIAADRIQGSGAVLWAARNSAKPGRKGPEAWVIQASPAWSLAHLGADPDIIVESLLTGLAAMTGTDLPAPIISQAHSWLYARSGASGRGCLWDRGLNLGVCGDWLLGPRVECAWLSGRGLAAAMLGRPIVGEPRTGAGQDTLEPLA